MVDCKQLLITQWKAGHDQDGWFAPFNVAVRGVTEEQATRGGEGSSNSIYGIVRHLLFWNERFLMQFIEGAWPPLEISNAETFQSAGEPESWEELRLRAEGLFNAWEKAIMECDQAKLESVRNTHNGEVWATTLAHMAIHNAYHIGQIVHIRKSLGLWEAWEE